MSRIFCPPGPTSSTSMSSENVWLRFFRVTVTLLTLPTTPATLMFHGYGLAGPEVPVPGMAIAVGLLKVLVEFEDVPMVKVLVTVPRLVMPSERDHVAVIVPPQDPVAVNEKSLVAVSPDDGLGVK